MAASASSAPPADRLAPDEVAPGTEVVFDLPLPRGSHVTGKFSDAAYATIPRSPEETVAWVRAHAYDTDTVVGPRGTVFPKIRARGATGPGSLRVEITRGAKPNEAAMIVDTIAPDPPPAPKIPDDELMRRAGLTPDGKLLDPKHTD